MHSHYPKCSSDIRLHPSTVNPTTIQFNSSTHFADSSSFPIISIQSFPHAASDLFCCSRMDRTDLASAIDPTDALPGLHSVDHSLFIYFFGRILCARAHTRLLRRHRDSERGRTQKMTKKMNEHVRLINLLASIRTHIRHSGAKSRPNFEEPFLSSSCPFRSSFCTSSRVSRCFVGFFLSPRTFCTIFRRDIALLVSRSNDRTKNEIVISQPSGFGFFFVVHRRFMFNLDKSACL